MNLEKQPLLDFLEEDLQVGYCPLLQYLYMHHFRLLIHHLLLDTSQVLAHILHQIHRPQTLYLKKLKHYLLHQGLQVKYLYLQRHQHLLLLDNLVLQL
jgi:hypothetical protein